MKLQVIATGSTGNCYALHHGEKILLLDAGIPASRILKEIGHRARDIVGCLVTHEHKDHSAGALELVSRGIPCYGTPGTAKVAQGIIPWSGAMLMWPFIVKPVPVLHDAVEPCGWLIGSRLTGEKMIYATDTYWLPNTYPRLNYWLIECNYCDDLVARDDQVRKRLETSHMSLKRLCELLEQNDLSNCRKIVLCHVSQARGDYVRMQREVWERTGISVEVAQAGMTFPLELEPF